MINEAIRIGIKENITSKLTLRNHLYPRFKNEFHTSYISMAVFKAHALLKNYRKNAKKNPNTMIPRISTDTQFLIIDSAIYKLIHSHVQIPTRPREFVTIPLNCYVINTISDPSLKLGNITLTANTLCISFSKEAKQQKPAKYIGIDMNLNNITCCDSDRQIHVFDISKITKTKYRFRQVKSNFKRNDHRVKKKLFAKYGIKQRNKEDAILHKISKKITSHYMQIILEDLKRIRKLYRKGNGQGRKFRFGLNSWSRYKLQQQIVYKSKWSGIDTMFVNPRGTSSKCSICDGIIIEENRMIRCPQCGLHVDRDVNAARNILARGLQKHQQDARFEPDAPQIEVMKQFKDAEQIVASQLVVR